MPLSRETALSTVLRAAEVRRDQWQAVADGSELTEVVNELYEVFGWQGQEMADLLTEAIETLNLE